MSASNQSKGFTELAPTALIADLRATRVAAGIRCVDAAIKLGIPVEILDDIEAGKMNLSLTELRGYAYAVGAVVEYSVTSLK